MKQLLFLHIVTLGILVTSSSGAVAQRPTQSPDGIFTRMDRNKDGKLTAEEMTGGTRGFFKSALKFVDRDKNGELSKQEFMLAIEYQELIAEDQGQTAGRFGQGNTPSRRPQFDARRIFQGWDRDGDGKVTMDELPQEARARTKWVFDRLGKKEFTLEEFVKLRQRFAGAGNRPGDNWEFFKRFDSNKDGKLTLGEVPEALRARFRPAFQRLGKEMLTPEDFAKIRNQAGRQQSPGTNRRPQESDKPSGDRRKKPE